MIFVISQADFFGSPHIGIYCIANDHIAFVPHNIQKKLEEKIAETLKVDVVKASVSNTGLFGIFCTLNNKTLIVSDIIEDSELNIMKDYFSDVVVLEDKYNALGNLIAMNDHGAIFSTYFDSMRDIMKNSINVRIAGTDMVGSSLFATNKAFLANPNSSPKDLEHIEKVMGVKGDIGTVNFGDNYVKSGLVGNKHGILVGSRTSGPELGRISEVFL